MTSIMRRTVRGTAAGLGALAIVAGTAACGGLIPGGGGEGDAGDSGTSAEASPENGEDAAASEDEGGEDAAAEDDGDGAVSEEGGEDPAAEEDGEAAATGEALAEEDLTAVGDIYYEFITASLVGDGETACSLVLDPNTGQPLEGTELTACAEVASSAAEEEGVDPSMAEMLERSMIEATDNGDGTASVSLMGKDGGVTFIEGDDGNWYIDGGELI